MGEAASGGTSLPLVAVGVDKDKSSQGALKWALDNLITKGQIVILVHVNTKPSLGEEQAKEIFVPFRCFSKRKDVKCFDVILVNTDVAKAIVDFVVQCGIEKLVVGSSRGGFIRYADISTSISKSVPDFCTAYVINRGKVSSVRHAARPAPTISPLRTQIRQQADPAPPPQYLQNLHGKRARAEAVAESISRSPLNIRPNFHSTKTDLEKMLGSVDLSFVTSCSESTASYVFPHKISNMHDGFDCTLDQSVQSPCRLFSAGTGYSSASRESFLSEEAEYIEAEMTRLKLELKQTMDKYKAACKDFNAAKQKAMDLKHWKMEGNQRLEETRLAEEVALALAEKEKAKCRAALEAADAAKWIAALETQKKVDTGRKILRAEEGRGIDSMNCCSMAVDELRYRRYTIEEIELATDYFAEKRKIGEGGYGPVFRCYLDHTPVAVKVLRADAAQGQAQFQREVEILSCIRHPSMVLLLGACPEYGCLVYEYMANGSLEDRLFRRGNTPTIPWPARFRIAAEIATGLLFLHQTKPEPLVHRDLKPANILLDHNYISKIGDVGLARLVPPTVADQVTQYRLTAAAGTFCYIDPEYQQTGMLGTKSDVYSLGVLLLQLVTAKSPMGLSHQVEQSLEKGMFPDMLDPTVRDWPVEEASALARLALKCTELRRKDRPDLGTVVLPELNRLRSISEKYSYCESMPTSSCPSPAYGQVSVQDVRSGPFQQLSGYESSRTQYSG